MRLTYGQLSMASHVAIMRRASNMLKGLPPRYGASNGEGSWEMDINACCAELAVARYTNLFWCGSLNDFSARDVGGIIDVRSMTKSHYQLILHPDDPDGAPFVLVWTNPPEFELTGWMCAATVGASTAEAFTIGDAALSGHFFCCSPLTARRASVSLVGTPISTTPKEEVCASQLQSCLEQP